EDSPPDSPDRGNVGGKTQDEFENSDETTVAEQLQNVLKRFLSKNQKIYIIAIESGSIIVTFNIDDDAILRIVEAFSAGELPQIEELIIHTKGFVSRDDPRRLDILAE